MVELQTLRRPYERMMGNWSRVAGEIFLDWLAPLSGLRWIDVGCATPRSPSCSSNGVALIPRTFVLCAPFWSGSAHVMALGPVVVEQRTPQGDSGNSNPVR